MAKRPRTDGQTNNDSKKKDDEDDDEESESDDSMEPPEVWLMIYGHQDCRKRALNKGDMVLHMMNAIFAIIWHIPHAIHFSVVV